MPARKPYADNSMIPYLEKEVLELRALKSQAEIATEAGFTNANMMAMIKSGATRLPLIAFPLLRKPYEQVVAWLPQRLVAQPVAVSPASLVRVTLTKPPWQSWMVVMCTPSVLHQSWRSSVTAELVEGAS